MLERGRRAELADRERERRVGGENEREGARARLRLEHSRLFLRDLSSDHSTLFNRTEKQHELAVRLFLFEVLDIS